MKDVDGNERSGIIRDFLKIKSIGLGPELNMRVKKGEN